MRLSTTSTEIGKETVLRSKIGTGVYIVQKLENQNKIFTRWSLSE